MSAPENTTNEEVEGEEEELDWNKEEAVYSTDLAERVPKAGAGVMQIILKLLKQISPGNPFYRISLPIDIIQPVSLLELMSKHSNPCNFLTNIHRNRNPLFRFVKILKWQFSTWKNINRVGLSQVKPYNPILGEFFSCYWNHKEDKSVTYWLGEQVLHHPPVSAFYCENVKRGFQWTGNIYPQLKASGMKSVSSYLRGNYEVTLRKFKNEKYTFVFPPVCCSLGIIGSSTVEISENLTLSCPSNQISAKINFGREGHISGSILDEKKNEVVFSILGHVDKCTYILKGEHSFIPSALKKSPDQLKQFEFVNFQKLKPDTKRVKPLKDQEWNESRRNWHRVTREVYRETTTDDENGNNFAKGSIEKLRVEDRQRKFRKERKDGTRGKHVQEFFENVSSSGKDSGVKKLEDEDQGSLSEEELINNAKVKWCIRKEKRDLLVSKKL